MQDSIITAPSLRHVSLTFLSSMGCGGGPPLPCGGLSASDPDPSSWLLAPDRPSSPLLLPLSPPLSSFRRLFFLSFFFLFFCSRDKRSGRVRP